MVHALREVWRVVDVNGTVVDLRPVSSTYPIEVVTDLQAIVIGEAAGLGMAAEDAAADRAVERMVADGWLAVVHQSGFDFELYWDSATGLRAALTTSERIRGLTPSLEALAAAQEQLGKDAGEHLRLRCRLPMMLAAYRKLSQ